MCEEPIIPPITGTEKPDTLNRSEPPPKHPPHTLAYPGAIKKFTDPGGTPRHGGLFTYRPFMKFENTANPEAGDTAKPEAVTTETVIWCIGNGPSRKGLDLNILRNPLQSRHHILIGCNSACAPDQPQLDFGVSCHSEADEAPGARLVLDAWASGRLSGAWVADPPVKGESTRQIRCFDSPARHRHPKLRDTDHQDSTVCVRPDHGVCSGALSVGLAGQLADRILSVSSNCPKITLVLLGHDFGGGHLLEKPEEARFGGNFQEQTLNRCMAVSCTLKTDLELVLACDLPTLVRVDANCRADASSWGRLRVMDEFRIMRPEIAFDRLSG